MHSAAHFNTVLPGHRPISRALAASCAAVTGSLLATLNAAEPPLPPPLTAAQQAALDAMRETGSKTRAAEMLGIPRQSLQKMMKRLEIGEDEAGGIG